MRLMTNSPRERTSWMARPWWVLLAPLAVIVVYYPVVRYQYTWDDLSYFLEDSIYRDPARFWQSLRQPFVMSPNYFRPLTVLTFLLEMQTRIPNPGLSHWINLLLHAFNSALVGCLGFLVVKERPDRGFWALAMAIFYGLHPAMTEGVALVSTRFDLMMTGFLILALIAELSLRRKIWLRVAVVSLLFLAAALCKEMAVAFVPVLALWQWVAPDRAGSADGKRKRDDQLLLFGGLILAGVAYLLIRYGFLGYLFRTRYYFAIDTGSLGSHLLLVFKSLARYFTVILWPFTVVRPIHFTELPVPYDDWQAWAGLLGSLALIALWARNRKALGSMPLWFALPVLAALPVLNLAPVQLTGDAFVSDTYLTFPLALFAIALGVALGRSREANRGGEERALRWPLVLMMGWMIASAMVVRFSILPHWENDRALWTWGVRIAPRSALPHANLSGEYSATGDYASGLREAQTALDLDPDYVDALSNLGVALMGLGRISEAVPYWERAVKLNMNDYVLWTNLAAGYRVAGRYEDSVRALKEHALLINPRDGYAILNLGLTYQAAGQPDLAREYLEKSIPLLPWQEADVARQRLQALTSP
jgi:VanZ family protein